MVGKAATIRCERAANTWVSLRVDLIEHFPTRTHSRVSDLVGLLILRNVKVDSDEDLFPLQRDVGDGELA